MDPLFRRLATNTTLFMQSCLLTGDVACVGQPNAMGYGVMFMSASGRPAATCTCRGGGFSCPCVSPRKCLANSP
jgi:hypothetical protein